MAWSQSCASATVKGRVRLLNTRNTLETLPHLREEHHLLGYTATSRAGRIVQFSQMRKVTLVYRVLVQVCCKTGCDAANFLEPPRC